MSPPGTLRLGPPPLSWFSAEREEEAPASSWTDGRSVRKWQRERRQVYGRPPPSRVGSGRRGKGSCVMEPALRPQGVREGFAVLWADFPSTQKGEKATLYLARDYQTLPRSNSSMS